MKTLNALRRGAVSLPITLIIGLSTVWVAHAENSRRSGKPFDYYVLSLSWSPEYCASRGSGRDSEQCSGARRYAFVVHGLWPQYERGYPSNCESTNGVPRKTIDRLLPIMPSRALIRHEWAKHGTCSGFGPDLYFARVETAYRSLRIPPLYEHPHLPIEQSPRMIRAAWVQANPKLANQSFVLQCRGRYLSEIRFCLDKSLQPRACGTDVRENCRAESVILRPVR